MAADRGGHGEGQHDQGCVAMPAAPGAGLVVVEADLAIRASPNSGRIRAPAAMTPTAPPSPQPMPPTSHDLPIMVAHRSRTPTPAQL